MQLLIISENILLFISGTGIVQGIFLSTLIYFHPKSDRSVNAFLSFFVVCMSIPMCLPLAQHFFSWQVFIFLLPFSLLQGPLLFLYVRSFKEVITWEKAWPHFLLFLIYCFINGWFSIGIGSKYPPSRNVPDEVLHNPLSITIMILRYVQMLVYVFFARIELISYQRSIQHLFSETSRINLSWVKLLANGYIIIVFTAMGIYFVTLRYPGYYSLLVLINTVIVSFYIYIAVFKGMYQPAIWQLQPGMSKKRLEEEMNKAAEIEVSKNREEKKASLKIRMGDRKNEEIVDKIISALERDNLYQEPELSLQTLADKLQVPSYQVSQAINEGLGKNFYDLINGYRVKEAKRLLLDAKNRNHTILSVGFDAGFNSKTTFNTVFKKFTGFTPTEYRDKQNNAKAIA